MLFLWEKLNVEVRTGVDDRYWEAEQNVLVRRGAGKGREGTQKEIKEEQKRKC